MQLSGAAAVGLIGFVWWELPTSHPIVNIRVLRSRPLAVAAVFRFVTGLGLFTPVFAQHLLYFPVLNTGLLLVPGALVAIFTLLLTARTLQSGCARRRPGVGPVTVILSDH